MCRGFRGDTAAIGPWLGPDGHDQIVTLRCRSADARRLRRLTWGTAGSNDRESTSKYGCTQRVLKALLSAQKPPPRPKNWPEKFRCNWTSPANFPCNWSSYSKRPCANGQFPDSDLSQALAELGPLTRG